MLRELRSKLGSFLFDLAAWVSPSKKDKVKAEVKAEVKKVK